MTKSPIVTFGCLFAMCLGLTHAHAQATCPQPLSGGAPAVEQQHIFCGEINRSGKAVGFHSRPGGTNPATVTNTGTPNPITGWPGLYNLGGFTISENGHTAVKTLSTMYPDKCSAANVIAAIQNAYNTGSRNGGQFDGMSGTSCTTDDGKPFPIRGFTASNGGLHIRTAYPNP